MSQTSVTRGKGGDAPGESPRGGGGVQETLISIIIAFALAFVFRGFVMEAFVIPTGSMAPTLLGQHVRMGDAGNGHTWPVGPRDPLRGEPYPLQGTAADPLAIVDPLTKQALPSRYNVPRRAGDRIFVMKYFYSIYDPKRFDVVVFKCPYDPNTAYIKRLVGLPGEETALIDGDVWYRPCPEGPAGENPWLEPGWRIARKPERAQRAMWQDVFDSSAWPRPDGGSVGVASLPPLPWKPGGDWDLSRGTAYEHGGAGEASLAWDESARPIVDEYAYDALQRVYIKHGRYPVGDLALSLALQPHGAGPLKVSASVLTRGHEFQGALEDGKAIVRSRPAGGGEWRVLDERPLAGPWRAGQPTNVELWHVDQSVQLWVEGRLVARGDYDWTPDERLRAGTTLGAGWGEFVEDNPGALFDGSTYRPSTARLDFSGGPFTLTRVRLARDIYYQPDMFPSRRPALATHPSTTMRLGPDQFFVCGDNSPQSLDARLWEEPDPWVARDIDPTPGIVPRDLLIGKAFFVYFPAPHMRGRIPVPDFGRMRFIW